MSLSVISTLWYILILFAKILTLSTHCHKSIYVPFLQTFFSLIFSFPWSWRISQPEVHHCLSPHIFWSQATSLSTQKTLPKILPTGKISPFTAIFLVHLYNPLCTKLTYPGIKFSLFTSPIASHRGPTRPLWSHEWAEEKLWGNLGDDTGHLLLVQHTWALWPCLCLIPDISFFPSFLRWQITWFMLALSSFLFISYIYSLMFYF